MAFHALKDWMLDLLYSDLPVEMVIEQLQALFAVSPVSVRPERKLQAQANVESRLPLPKTYQNNRVSNGLRLIKWPCGRPGFSPPAHWLRRLRFESQTRARARLHPRGWIGWGDTRRLDQGVGSRHFSREPGGALGQLRLQRPTGAFIMDSRVNSTRVLGQALATAIPTTGLSRTQKVRDDFIQKNRNRGGGICVIEYYRIFQLDKYIRAYYSSNRRINEFFATSIA